MILGVNYTERLFSPRYLNSLIKVCILRRRGNKLYRRFLKEGERLLGEWVGVQRSILFGWCS